MSTETCSPAPARHVRDAGARSVAPFLLVGLVTTVAWLGLYDVLRPHVGAQASNALALLVTADANTLLNRRYSFRGHGGRLKGWVAFGAGLGLTSGALAALSAAGHDQGTTATAVLLAAEVVGGVVHFLLLRSWAFAPAPSSARPCVWLDPGPSAAPEELVHGLAAGARLVVVPRTGSRRADVAVLLAPTAGLLRHVRRALPAADVVAVAPAAPRPDLLAAAAATRTCLLPPGTSPAELLRRALGGPQRSTALAQERHRTVTGGGRTLLA